MRHLPLVTGVLLAALLAVPIWLREHRSHLKERIIEVALPARNALLEVQIAFASELAAVRGYELTGNREFLDDLSAGLEKDRDASRRLSALAGQLGPGPASAVLELDARKREWLTGPTEALAGKLSREQLIQSLAEGERQVDGVLAAANRANTTLISAEAEIRQAVSRDEGTAGVLISVLALAALAVISVVGWLVRRLNLLAAELRQGVEEEASLHHVAGALNGAPSVEVVGVAAIGAAMQWTRSSAAYLERLNGETVTIAAARGTGAPAEGSTVLRDESATVRALNGMSATGRRGTHSLTVSLDDPGATTPTRTLVVPLMLDSTPWGSLVLNRAMSAAEYSDGEVAYSVAVGDLVAAALGRVMLIEREHNARMEAEEAVRYRDQMLRVVSHDLKNPLHTIGMAVDLIATVELTEQQRKDQLRIVARTADRMNRLIHDLLDAARVQSGRALSVSPAQIDTRDFLTETIEPLRVEARAKNIRLVCDADSAPLTLFADRDRLAQVFSNLVSNALKFTGEGGRIDVNAARSESGGVLFSIADSGPGIAAEDLPHLFEPFWQASDRMRLGTGLGLSIARGIVEAHGGNISVHSVPGEGTTFEFDIPSA